MKSNNIGVLIQKGLHLHQSGDLSGASACYQEVLNINPLHFDALHLSGLIAAKNEQFDIAIELICRALKVNQGNAIAFCNLGNVYLNMGKYELAIENYSLALSLKPNYEEAYYSKGLSFQRLNQFQQAQVNYESALQINPGHIGALTNLGNTYQLQKKYELAIKCYQNAINLNLPFAEPFNNRGNLYHEQKKYPEAIADFDRALKIKPNYAEALSNKANSLFALKNYSEAVDLYGRAISLKKDYAEAYHNRANLWRELKQYELAAADYEKTLEIKPNYDYVSGVLLGTKMNLCDWENLDFNWSQIENQINASKKVISPFLTIPISDSIALQGKAASIWVKDKCFIPMSSGAKVQYDGLRKIKIGYFSADFHDHATMFLIAQLFELHDKNKFETIGFSFGPDKNDGMRARAIGALDKFYDVRGFTDEQTAQLSRDLEVDIAVDLKGFTMDARIGIFANRAAPIQVNYLGYPGTLGVDFMDYIIADRIVIPEEFKHLYSEEVAYLPNCYQVNDQKRIISDKKFSKDDLGLPASGFVFCCFNANYKITPKIFDVWARILLQTPNSVLWLYKDCMKSAENLCIEAKKRGVDPSRLIFAEQFSVPDHLARHSLADLFLDTSPCNAHTTASDALWAGLPVLTCAGQTFASRVAASLLHAVDLPELVVSNLSDYESVAISIASNSDLISKYKQKLSKGLENSTLFNSLAYTKNLEDLYTHILIEKSQI